MDLTRIIGSWIGGTFENLQQPQQNRSQSDHQQDSTKTNNPEENAETSSDVLIDSSGLQELKGLDHFSEGAQKLIVAAFEDIETETIDYHTHIAGIGCGGSGCIVHQSMRSPYLHPFNRIKFQTFMSASGVTNEVTADRDFVLRLVQLIRHCRLVSSGKWGRHVILPLDHWHDQDGTERPDISGLYCPNQYVWSIAKEFPDCFIPACSVHPYRPNAPELLQIAFDAGCRLCKWLPNSMGIDPSDERCDVFYSKLVSLGMVLLSHVGEEHSVEGGAINQHFGNPLLLRRALARGVKVIAAHCASEGTGLDLDLLYPPQNYSPSSSTPSSESSTSTSESSSPSSSSSSSPSSSPSPQPSLSQMKIEGPKVYRENFELLMRMMAEEEYKELLFADISAMISIKRCGLPLTSSIDFQHLHHRLLAGSDYPVPCISLVVQTKLLYVRGYITYPEVTHLNEIYRYNPLLFDYVVKRTLRSPKTGLKFSASIFQPNPNIFPPPHK